MASDWLDSINEGEVLDEGTVKAYAERYYSLLRKVLLSSEPNAWNAWEYQSQQLISVMSPKNFTTFRDYLINIIDTDDTCDPYVKKIMFMGIALFTLLAVFSLSELNRSGTNDASSSTILYKSSRELIW